MSESLLTVENLSKSYGEKVLFENVSFGINRGQKTAFIAPNGSGKSTLLKIISGEAIPDDGTITLRNDIKVAYLSQNPELDEQQTIMDVVFSSENKYFKAIREYEQSLLDLKTADTPENQEAFHKASSQMDLLGAWDYENRIKEILSRLQVTDFSKKIHMLSGGERKKVALAKILIDESDFLILDEPTNHLDIAMIEWLEEFLSKQSLSILLVSHDRYFLDNVCTDILELDNGGLYKYKGNFQYYLEKREERKFVEQQEIEKAKNLYKTELEWMRRMPSARGTKAKSRIDAFYDLKKKATQRIDTKEYSLTVKADRVGGKILELYNVSKKFGNQVLLDDFSYTFKRGEKIGIVGRNGIGKSTLLNMIMGELRQDEGKIITGQTIKYGYYSQVGLTEKEDRRAIEIIKEVAEVVRLEDGKDISASQFLERFGFSHTTQYNYFSNLSGGERRRLYLLKTLISNPNFLILDEPTNDLDIQTLEKLEDFLINYKGCLLIVSHDRSFLDNIVDHIFVFEGEGKVKDFYGNYSEYIEDKVEKEKDIVRQAKQEKPKVEKPKSTKNKPTYKETQEFGNLEKEIKELELEKSQLTEKLNSGNLPYEELEKSSNRISEIIELLEEKELRWLELSEICE